MFLSLFNVVGVFNPVYVSLYAICPHHGTLFRSGERDQDYFVDMLCDINFCHDNIKGKKSHLGCVYSIVILCWTCLLPLGIH